MAVSQPRRNYSNRYLGRVTPLPRLMKGASNLRVAVQPEPIPYGTKGNTTGQGSDSPTG